MTNSTYLRGAMGAALLFGSAAVAAQLLPAPSISTSGTDLPSTQSANPSATLPAKPIQTQPAPAPVVDPMTQARAALARGDAAEALARFLRVLAQRPNDLEALTGAGHSALAIGDPNAAISFYARAEEIAPRNGRVKAGLGAALVQIEQPRPALRMFSDALDLGVPLADIAADRGLAYDLRGDSKRAQQDYQVALRSNPDDETLRRLALSMAISGDRQGALTMLDPLLRKKDMAAWRARAFVHALTGDMGEAETVTNAVMPRGQASLMIPFLGRLAELKPAQKAMAVHFGHLPSDGRVYAEGEVFADAGIDALPAPQRTGPAADTPLIPAGRPLGTDADAKQPGLADQLAARAPLTRASRRRPGDTADAPAKPVALAANDITMPKATEVEKAPPTKLTAKPPAPKGPAPSLAMDKPPASVGPLGDPADKGPAPAPDPAPAASSPAKPTATEAKPLPMASSATSAPAGLATLPGGAPSNAMASLAITSQPLDPTPTPVPPPGPTPAEIEAKRLADAKAAEAKKLADAKKAADAKKLADEKKAAEAKKLADAKKAADAKKLADEKKVADAKKLVDAKKAADTKKLADDKKAAEAKKAEEAKKLAVPTGDKAKHPQRHWVQVAGGANKADLPKAWRDTVAKWPKQLAGRTPWTTPLRFTNRLLIGPFKSAAEAQAYVNTVGGAGFSTFPFTSPAGQIVERVPAK